MKERKNQGLSTRQSELKKIFADSGIAAYCRKHLFTESSYFHAAFLLVLYLLTRQRPFICSTYNGRTERPKDLKHTFGLFARSVPVVLRPDASLEELKTMTAEAFIGEVQAQLMETYSRPSVLYSELPIRTDILMVFQGEIGRQQIKGHEAERLDQDVPKFPIFFNIAPKDDSYEITLQYDFASFAEKDMLLLLNAYLAMLGRLCRAERLEEASLKDVGGAYSPSDKLGRRVFLPEGSTWVEDFQKEAKLRPDHCAVFAGNGSYTYRELDAPSDAVAVYLTELGVRENDFVGVKMERVREFLPAVLGIQKCGAAYVPIDMDYPEKRMEYILRDSGAKYVLTQKTVENLKGRPRVSFAAKTAPDHLAYMMYTSGTTGEPKGTLIPHRALYNFLRFVVREMHLTPESRISCYPSFSFDLSIEGLYAPLLAGGTVCIVPSEVRKDIGKLEEWLKENGVTGGCYPTQVGHLLGRNEPLPHEYVTLVGEKMTRVPGVTGRVINGYGPTECTVYNTWYELDKSREYLAIPIGKPIDNNGVVLLDPFGNLLPDGAIGELCITGVQLAAGYHNKPERTAKAFRTLREYPDIRVYHTGDMARYMEDGNLLCLGREDRQLKRRGYRIEPGEIEHAALSLPGVREGAVLAQNDKLILYYTLQSSDSGNPPTDELSIEAGLEAALPSYMNPDSFMRLDQMPLTPNGKINMNMLPKYVFQSRSYTPPRNETEAFICRKMAEILRVGKVGVTDDFFELGGSSLSAVLLAGELGEHYEIRDIYQGRNAEGILKSSQHKRRIVGIPPRPVYPLAADQNKFFSNNSPDRPEVSYSNVPALYRLPPETDLEALRAMLIRIVENHPYLKVRYARDGQAGIVARRNDGIPTHVELLHTEKLNPASLIQPYNLLGNEDLYRIALFETQAAEKYLFYDFNHILMDAVSFRIMGKDLRLLMEGKAPEPEKATGYEVGLEEEFRRAEEEEEINRYYAGLFQNASEEPGKWLADRKDTEAAERWRKQSHDQTQLAGLVSARKIVSRKSRVSMAHVRARCQSLHITETMFFNAAFACFLGECAGTGEALYATVLANRDNSAFDNTVTMLCRTVPIYLKATEKALSTPAFLLQLRSALANAGKGSVFSFDGIYRKNRVKMPRITMIYYDRPVDEQLLPGWEAIPLEHFDTIEDLMVKIYSTNDESLFFSLDFDAFLHFTQAEREAMADRLEALIANF